MQDKVVSQQNDTCYVGKSLPRYRYRAAVARNARDEALPGLITKYTIEDRVLGWHVLVIAEVCELGWVRASDLNSGIFNKFKFRNNNTEALFSENPQ